MTGPEPAPVTAASVTAAPVVVAPVVVDVAPVRIRLPVDLLRLAVLVLVLLVLAGLGTVASDTVRGAGLDLARLVGRTPDAVIRLFGVLGAVSAVAVPLGLMVAEIARGHTRRLVEALLTGLATIGLIEALDQLLAEFPASALYGGLTGAGAGQAVRPLDAYLAALLALVTVIGLPGDPRGRRSMVAMTALYVASVFTGTQTSLLSPLASITIGATVGVLVRYVAGRANELPGGVRIAAELARRGIPLTRLERVRLTDQGFRSYLATRTTGARLTVHVLDRELIASGALYSLYRLIRIRSEIAPPPALSLERVAERRALLAMAATAAEVPAPRLVAGVPCGPDTILLAYEAVPAEVLRTPTDEQLAELWAGAARLHQHQITHRGFTVGAIQVDPRGHVLLPIPTDGTAFATQLRISLERAQLLVTCAQLAGVERAVRSARTALSRDQLAATLAVLQPIALPRATRQALTSEPGLLEALRDRLQGPASTDLPELTQVERVRPRTIISVAALIVAGYLIAGQFGTVNLRSVLATAHWRWIPLVLLASAATYPSAALSLIGYVRERLPFPRTVLVQMAADFAGFVTPPSVGGIAINIQYLRKAKLSTTAAATSVGTSQVVNAASHAVLLAVFGAATGTASRTSLPIPGWVFVGLGIAAALSLLALAIPRTRHALAARVLPPAREAVPRLLNLLTDPVKLAEALLGSLFLNLSYIAALWFAVLAFDGTVAFVGVAVVYLAGAAIGSLAPTPGGLGAIEIAFATGLTAAGMPGAAAFSAVLLYRLATFWLPVPVGWAALHWLQRHEAL
jgi:uncharacterized membrane protein YbhN (UPF0104 family)